MSEITPLQREALELKKCYEFILDTVEGKRVLADLADQAFLVKTTVVAGDPNLTVFNEGRRSLFLWILERLEMQPIQVRNFYKEITENE